MKPNKPTEPGCWYWYEKHGLERELEMLQITSEDLRRQIEADYRRPLYVDYYMHEGKRKLCGNFPGGQIPIEWLAVHGTFGPRIPDWKPEEEESK